MVWIPGGAFIMGSDHHFPEESPAHKVSVDGFHMDAHPVTNAEFAAFVEATGYVTLAELGPERTGSHVFLPEARTGEDAKRHGWRLLADADWQHPLGPDSDLRGLEDHPVVHVAYADAYAYARWAGKEIPTEAQWEFAARAGSQDEFPWGAELAPGGAHMANTWQGMFPSDNTAQDGYLRTSPVHAYPPNTLGLFDMIGNVWEWTTDFWAPRHDRPRANTIRRNPRVTNAVESCLAFGTSGQVPRRVLKGGSHLCDPKHSPRYRAPARRARAVDSPGCDIGFRCVRTTAPDTPSS
ncbi:formylglycine-generating enzyme family protein [Pseudoxanthomonas mexicana]|uniref:formylglycine-generating enzyme family protein n=1 Tax=Pseudoxanthomonas mexicana TaxID=128785 RepID=UPI001FD640CC|nr:formylglycine-generating enzyme family protein [Pseudoxanthomonas mexicana]UOV02960.1 formylglycine-generating enzyme family protein [Pseudoxanthomonas mexicana]